MKKFAHIIVQGYTINGVRGTFIKDEMGQISPTFDGLYQLFPWMKQSGWVRDECDGAKYIPWRVSKSLNITQ